MFFCKGEFDDYHRAPIELHKKHKFSGLPPKATFPHRITDLGTLLSGTFSASNGINASGEVTGVFGGPPSHAFLYNGKTMITLGTLGGTNSVGLGINNSGEVTGFAENSAGLQHAFLYNGKTMLDLGVLPGANAQIANSNGYAINGRGEVAGTSVGSTGTPHAFLYNGTTMIDLGTFGGTNSVGLGACLRAGSGFLNRAISGISA
jgi:probable HAF family extracellular repeat protein